MDNQTPQIVGNQRFPAHKLNESLENSKIPDKNYTAPWRAEHP